MAVPGLMKNIYFLQMVNEVNVMGHFNQAGFFTFQVNFRTYFLSESLYWNVTGWSKSWAVLKTSLRIENARSLWMKKSCQQEIWTHFQHFNEQSVQCVRNSVATLCLRITLTNISFHSILNSCLLFKLQTFRNLSSYQCSEKNQSEKDLKNSAHWSVNDAGPFIKRIL